MAGYFTHSDVSSFMNSTSKQISKNWGVTTGAAVSGTFTIYPTETTTGAINVAFKGTHSGAATDNIVLEELAIIVVK
jgi:ethanolamine utilization microcompartment shell protein EutS